MTNTKWILAASTSILTIISITVLGAYKKWWSWNILWAFMGIILGILIVALALYAQNIKSKRAEETTTKTAFKNSREITEHARKLLLEQQCDFLEVETFTSREIGLANAPKTQVVAVCGWGSITKKPYVVAFNCEEPNTKCSVQSIYFRQEEFNLSQIMDSLATNPPQYTERIIQHEDPLTGAMRTIKEQVTPQQKEEEAKADI